jgi:hypothetical protein
VDNSVRNIELTTRIPAFHPKSTSLPIFWA